MKWDNIVTCHTIHNKIYVEKRPLAGRKLLVAYVELELIAVLAEIYS